MSLVPWTTRTPPSPIPEPGLIGQDYHDGIARAVSRAGILGKSTGEQVSATGTVPPPYPREVLAEAALLQGVVVLNTCPNVPE